MKKQNKFKIITPSYNNEEWCEYNVASVLNQTYTNYEVLYINDASTDNTYTKIKELVGNLPNWKIINNETNQGAISNYFIHLQSYLTDDQDIVVHLDGDDWLFDENVLEKLNNTYNEHDYWMTYGGFIGWDGSDRLITPYPQNTPHDNFVHKHKLYRKDAWRASHLRTYRAFLLKQLPLDVLKSLEDGKYYWHAGDLAFQYPLMEVCTQDKIGVVDFYTCVYNQSKENVVRTQEREHINNSKYEVEIRNRKHFKEGLPMEQLPQVNVWNQDYYLEYCDIPTKFTYCYQQSDGEFDMTLLCDSAILQYLAGEFKVDRNVPLVCRLFEQREYFQRRIYHAVIENYDKFDAILTFDRELLKILPNAIFLPPTEVTQFNRLPNPYGYPPYKSDKFNTYELPQEAFQIYPKSKLISAIVSSKAFLPGHMRRLEFIKSVRHKIDLFGRGMGRELPSKLDGLRDYMFSIAIENISTDDNYFSEKIIDCFLTGTVPIYHGCINISEFFDKRGILYFQTQEELDTIIDSLTPEKYSKMLPYVQANFEACYKWPLNNDMLYDMYYKQIIENGVTREQ